MDAGLLVVVAMSPNTIHALDHVHRRAGKILEGGLQAYARPIRLFSKSEAFVLLEGIVGQDRLDAHLIEPRHDAVLGLPVPRASTEIRGFVLHRVAPHQQVLDLRNLQLTSVMAVRVAHGMANTYRFDVNVPVAMFDERQVRCTLLWSSAPGQQKYEFITNCKLHT